MRRIASSLLALLALAALATAGWVAAQPNSAPQLPVDQASAPPAGTSTATVERGRYLVQVGDCVACHTQRGGARFAGGRPLQTPFGTVLSANITPDADTGLGRWSAGQFYRALHEGKSADGTHLYPAFPYNYYTHITREDSDAIYAYLRTVPPVRHAFERNQLPFPFNVRALMVVWNWMFLDQDPVQQRADRSASWNRGAYLVQGLGHCAACHTPRNFLGGSKNGEAYQGGRFGDLYAPDITPNRRTGIGGWSDADLRDFLRLGANVHSDASAEMGEVVGFSTSQMNDADLDAVAAYLRSMPASPDAKPSAPDAAVMKQGEAIFQDSCAACHRMDGSGVPRLFPPLRGNSNVQQKDPTTVLHFILGGTRRTPTDRNPSPLSMPSYAWKLDDAQVAAVATYVRNSWGNAAEPVDAKAVGTLRGHLHFDLVRGTDTTQSLKRPTPTTLGPAETDSRDNGTAQAGRAAASATR